MMKNKNKIRTHNAVVLADVIFGLNVPVIKFLLDEWVSSMRYIFTRCPDVAVIFWLINLFIPKEPVERKDLFIIMLGSLFGFMVSQTSTAWVLVYVTPVYSSLTITPTSVAIVLMMAAPLKETPSGKKTIGILIGITGALLMVLMGWQSGSGTSDVPGISLTILSLLTWVIYLLITRDVSQKYSAVTQMKWILLTSTIVVLPLATPEWGQQKLLSAAWAWTGTAEMTFIVLFATVMGYFVIPFAMHYLSATTVNIYTSSQLVVASLAAIYIEQDVLTWNKPVAGILVLLSIYIITRKNMEQ